MIDGISSEVAMLRVITRRLFERAEEVITMDEMMPLVNVLEAASIRRAGLGNHMVSNNRKYQLCKFC